MGREAGPDAAPSFLALIRMGARPLQVMDSIRGVSLTPVTQLHLLEAAFHDPILSVLPPPLSYMTRLLKQLVASSEAQGQELSEPLLQAYTTCLTLPPEETASAATAWQYETYCYSGACNNTCASAHSAPSPAVPTDPACKGIPPKMPCGTVTPLVTPGSTNASAPNFDATAAAVAAPACMIHHRLSLQHHSASVRACLAAGWPGAGPAHSPLRQELIERQLAWQAIVEGMGILEPEEQLDVTPVQEEQQGQQRQQEQQQQQQEQQQQWQLDQQQQPQEHQQQRQLEQQQQQQEHQPLQEGAAHQGQVSQLLLQEEGIRGKPQEPCCQPSFVTLRANTNLFEGSTGCHPWEAGFLLAEYVLSHPGEFADRAVLEMGCGLGLLGACLHRVGAGPTALTDGDANTVVKCYSNLQLNGVPAELMPLGEGGMSCLPNSKRQLQCGRMLWGADCNNGSSLRPDAILGADLLYDPENIPGVVSVLLALLPVPEGAASALESALPASTSPHDSTTPTSAGSQPAPQSASPGSAVLQHTHGALAPVAAERGAAEQAKIGTAEAPLEAAVAPEAAKDGMRVTHVGSAAAVETKIKSDAGIPAVASSAGCNPAPAPTCTHGLVTPYALIATTLRNEQTFETFLQYAQERGLALEDCSACLVSGCDVRFQHRPPQATSDRALLTRVTRAW